MGSDAIAVQIAIRRFIRLPLLEADAPRRAYDLFDVFLSFQT